MQFGVQMIWRGQKDQAVLQQRKKEHIVYPNFQSATRPVEHSENLPVSKPPDQEIQSSSSADEHSSGEYVEANDPESENKPIPFSRGALNDLRRDVYLIK